MRNRGAVVAVVVMCLSCFSTAAYDRAHIQRVSSINARYDAALEREREHHAALVAELDRRRALVVPVASDAGGAPVNRVDQRADIVECRTMCGAKPGDPTELSRARSHMAQCLRDICLPSYVDALVKTYVHADAASATNQLALSSSADLETLLARSHNQALLAEIERQAAVLAQRHARARGNLEQQRQRELQTSMRQRDTEIATSRAARRARVKAAADAFAGGAAGQPGAAPAAASGTTAPSDRPAGHDVRDCATDPSCQPARARSITCTPDVDDTIAQAADPASRPPAAPSTPIGCTDPRDCPSGLTCDVPDPARDGGRRTGSRR
jgi:hypothetical protein